MRRLTKDGLLDAVDDQDAPDPLRKLLAERYTLKAMEDDRDKNMLLQKYQKKTVKEAIQEMRKGDILVTNKADKTQQLEKMPKLDTVGKDSWGSLEKRGVAVGSDLPAFHHVATLH